MDRTDEDVLRLQDLLGEIRRQMRPLRRQAKAADRYQVLKDEVVALRLYLGGLALSSHDRDLTISVSEKSRLAEQLEVDQKRLEKLSTDLGSLTEAANQVGSDLDRDTSAAALLETTNERLRRFASVSHERRRAISGRLEAAVERRSDLEDEAITISAELADIGSELDVVEADSLTAESRFRRLEDTERAMATQNSLSPEGALAAARGELSALESSLIRDERERQNLLRRLDVLSGQRRDETTEVERINQEIKSIDEKLSDLQGSYETSLAQRLSQQEIWSGAETNLATATLDVASATARVDAIRAAIQGRHDVETRNLVEAARGAVGALLTNLDIPDELESAVGAALGTWVDAVAFEDADSVREAVEMVKKTGGGAIPVVSAMSEASAPAREIALASGLPALIDRLGPKAHIGLATRLLGDVVLVEGWVSGWSLIAKHPGLRAVTPEGDLISVTGVLIANPDGAGPVMLETAEVALERAETDLARAQSLHTAACRDFDNSRETERVALESLETAETDLAGRSEAMGRIQQSVDSVKSEQKRLEERNGALDESSASAVSQVTALRERLAALEGDEAERLKVWEELEGQRLQLAADREIARSAWQDSAAKHGVVIERDRLLRERSERINRELARLSTGDRTEPDPARLERVEQFARRAVAILERGIEELRDRQLRLRDENSEVLGGLESVSSEHETLRNEIGASRERFGGMDVRLTELRLHREAVVEAIRRDADADAEAAVGAPRPDMPEDANLEEHLGSKLAQLARLGPINPLAAKEYRDLEERHSFLSEQMADVESSREELRKVITALEDEIDRRFHEAFVEVAEAYQRYFEVLFPGGRGRVRLIEPQDRTSGVAIDAQPLGKKISQMTLLSGGERSLAALAFLFRCSKPGPVRSMCSMRSRRLSTTRTCAGSSELSMSFASAPADHRDTPAADHGSSRCPLWSHHGAGRVLSGDPEGYDCGVCKPSGIGSSGVLSGYSVDEVGGGWALVARPRRRHSRSYVEDENAASGVQTRRIHDMISRTGH